MPEVSRLCLYPVPFLHCRARRKSGKNARKFDICFYYYCPGAEARLCRGSWMVCTSAQGEKFHSRAASGTDARGRRGRSREAPALSGLIPALCKSHFFQIRYMPAGLLSRNCCKVYSRSYI